MKERPILFSAPMVRALLAGTKTQTRRIVKPQPACLCRYEINGAGTHALHLGPPLKPGEAFSFVPAKATSSDHRLPCPYGAPGDRLWVKETHAIAPGENQLVAFRADGRCGAMFDGDGDRFLLSHGWVVGAADDKLEGKWYGLKKFGSRWRPSIFMPRWASRITLAVTNVRVERVQDISELDALAEGVEGRSVESVLDGVSGEYIVGSARDEYAELWRSINGAESWDENPWVWVVEFTRAA